MFPARRDADCGRFFVRVAAENSGHVRRKSLTDSRSAQHGEDDASGDAWTTVGPTGEDLPPIATSGFSIGLPFEHHPLYRVGDVAVRIVA